MNTKLLSITLVGALSASTAMASTSASAVTDLNLRAGPAPQYDILSVIPNEGEVQVEGCLAESSWCKVSYDGTQGWAYGDYLTVAHEGEPLILIENRKQIEIEAVTHEESNAGSVAAAGTIGAIAGGLLAGPAGAAAGAAAGGALGAVADPAEETIVYVREHQTEPVYLDGEVVVGAQLPDVVELQSVPETEYTYAYVNNVPVLVEPGERRVVYIVR